MRGSQQQKQSPTAAATHQHPDLPPSQPLPQQQKQFIHPQSPCEASSESSESGGWSKEVIEPAIKSMSFRTKRGTRMKELMKGKTKKDQFWERYQGYFGGDLNQDDEESDQEDYQASSSGRDEFDSDFDLTDSYVGKRGRKKGTKIKKRRRKTPKADLPKDSATRPARGRRGRKPKVVIQDDEAEPKPVQSLREPQEVKKKGVEGSLKQRQ